MIKKFEFAIKTWQWGKQQRWGVLLLFASTPTLLCCALPIIFVSLGMGSLVASIYIDKLPWLQWFGMNSLLTFSISGLILLISAYFLFKKKRSCPLDSKLSQICNNAQKWNIYFFYLASSIWLISALSAFVLPLVI